MVPGDYVCTASCYEDSHSRKQNLVAAADICLIESLCHGALRRSALLGLVDRHGRFLILATMTAIASVYLIEVIIIISTRLEVLNSFGQRVHTVTDNLSLLISLCDLSIYLLESLPPS